MLRRLTARDSATLRNFWAEALRTASAYFLLTEDELFAIPESSFVRNIESGYYIGAFDHDEEMVGFVVARRGVDLPGFGGEHLAHFLGVTRSLSSPMLTKAVSRIAKASSIAA